jgi:IS5 family transposase
VIERSRCPLPSGGGPIAEDVAALWEGWMRHVDELLADKQLVELVFDALARRWTHSRTRGRRGTPADVVLRLLVLKHVRNWSYGALEREVRANLVYRQFTHVGAGKVPDAKTLGRIGLALGPAVVERLHQRVVTISRECGIVEGRRMRVDTTVVETNIHYPTDASLLGDGVRVLTRTMKKITKLAGAGGAVLRDRSRSTQRCLIQIGRAARSRSDQGKQRLQQCYRRLLAISGRVAGQAKRFAQEVASGCKRSVDLLQQMTLQGHRAYIETMLPLVQQVMRQTRQRINHGNTHSPGKIVSLFEPHTEIIRKGKAGKPTEFGKMVKIQEVEQQIVTQRSSFTSSSSATRPS